MHFQRAEQDVFHTLPLVADQVQRRFRVYCLEQLRKQFLGLDETSQLAIKQRLDHPDADILWRNDVQAASGYDEGGEAPFNKSINVFENGVPS